MVIYSEFSHQEWWFSLVMLVYQRVSGCSNKLNPYPPSVLLFHTHWSSLSRSARSAFAADSSCNAHCHWEDFSQALMAALKVMMSTFWESPTGCISSNLRAVSHCAPRSHELMAALQLMTLGKTFTQAISCRHQQCLNEFGTLNLRKWWENHHFQMRISILRS